MAKTQTAPQDTANATVEVAKRAETVNAARELLASDTRDEQGEANLRKAVAQVSAWPKSHMTDSARAFLSDAFAYIGKVSTGVTSEETEAEDERKQAAERFKAARKASREIRPYIAVMAYAAETHGVKGFTTQDELAAQTGLNKQQISRLKTAGKVAAQFGVLTNKGHISRLTTAASNSPGVLKDVADRVAEDGGDIDALFDALKAAEEGDKPDPLNSLAKRAGDVAAEIVKANKAGMIIPDSDGGPTAYEAMRQLALAASAYVKAVDSGKVKADA